MICDEMNASQLPLVGPRSEPRSKKYIMILHSECESVQAIMSNANGTIVAVNSTS